LAWAPISRASWSRKAERAAGGSGDSSRSCARRAAARVLASRLRPAGVSVSTRPRRSSGLMRRSISRRRARRLTIAPVVERSRPMALASVR
jgi:hypothetical protein